MYAWLWRHLPGGVLLRSVLAVLLLAGAVVLLFLVVFPWLAPQLPGADVTVDPGGSGST